MTRRTVPSSGSTTLVNHAYPTHAHQRIPSISSPLASPSQVGSAAISAVHWVSARTKTRSKKSSSGVTLASSRIVALSWGRWGRGRVAMAVHHAWAVQP